MKSKQDQSDKSESKTRDIKKTLEIDAPISQVWKALTEAEELKKWFPLDAEVVPGENGSIKLIWGDLYAWEVHIESWDEEKHLKLGYQLSDDYINVNAEGGTSEDLINNNTQQLAIDYSLESSKGKTILRLVHSGFGADANWDDMYDGVRRGWDQELTSLQHYLKHHLGKKRMVSWSIIKPDLTVDQIWSRFMGEKCFNALDQLEYLKKGDQYNFVLDDGEIYRGTVLYLNAPMDFLGTIENLGNALLRVKIENFAEKPEADVWISQYDATDQQIQQFQSYWDRKLGSLFT
ncbi:SRPBCC domain-containing protein [Fulvivirgaceae bacterium BMA10]|uniref:SRPBCC domain-containing protein n=1 Tax=Splendidivirga corallicola TaxID=3051826 RepID=A0ABT8KTF0_9BACT|nr:SRPBCC domain-containing protein [Fulvivirgaceae bacterium BMA10]